MLRAWMLLFTACQTGSVVIPGDGGEIKDIDNGQPSSEPGGEIIDTSEPQPSSEVSSEPASEVSTEPGTEPGSEPTNEPSEPPEDDADGDGFLSEADGGLDCDDSDDSINPDAEEVCDGEDNNCDGDVDNAAVDRDTFFEDSDEDGFGNKNISTEACSEPSGYVSNDDDCNDDDDDINPNATEVCDTIDNDCDGDVDDDDSNVADKQNVFYDEDGDGFGGSTVQESCFTGDGWVSNSDDCDDGNNQINPDADEVCDQGVDNDCANGADDDDSNTKDSSKNTYYEDVDNDGGFGEEVLACVQGSGMSSTNTDCNETDSSVENLDVDGDGFSTCNGDCDDSTSGGSIYPGAIEIPDDGIDQNCSDSDLVSPTPEDLDGDGFTVADGDCNDGNPNVYPNAFEICDGFNNDCANGTDDADPFINPDSQTVYYTDEDGDGFFGTEARACIIPTGASLINSDCDDTDAGINLGAYDVPNNGIDEDCVGGDATQTGTNDLDGDGQDSVADGGLDCDDENPSVYDGASETPANGIDEDCDGRELCFYDGDNDGYGDSEITLNTPNISCSGTAQSDNSDDCDDADDEINPEAIDYAGDGIDQDCDGVDSDPALTDVDGDGFERIEVGGDDCDDDNPDINPAADETLWDNTDNDCDGKADNVPADQYDSALYGYEKSQLGYEQGLICRDIKGNSTPDLILGAATAFETYGAVYVYDGTYYPSWDGSVYTYLDADSIEIYGAGEDNHVSTVALGDVDDDGALDLMVAGTDRSRGSNSRWSSDNSVIASGIFSDVDDWSGSIGYDALSLASASMQFKDSSGPNGTVKSVIDFDMNGDGYHEVILSDYVDTSWGSSTGSSFVHVFTGSDMQDGDDYDLDQDNNSSTDSSFYLTMEESYTYVGQGLTTGDTDGDGEKDILAIAAPGASDGGATRAGCIFFVKDSDIQEIQTNLSIFGIDAFDGDGYLLTLGDNSILLDGQIPIELAQPLTICSSTENARTGWNQGVEFNDFDGDGQLDVAVGQPGINAVRIIYSIATKTGSLDLESEADVSFTGSSTGSFGFSLSSGDYNQDGIVDLAIGAPDFFEPANIGNNDASFVDAIFDEELLDIIDMRGFGSTVYLYSGTEFSSGGSFDSSAANGTIFSSSDALGTSMCSPDMNGDGSDDLWLAAPLYDSASGRVSLYLMD